MQLKQESTKSFINTQIHQISNVTYQDVWDLQMTLHNQLKRQKSTTRNYNKSKSSILNHVVLCEHLPVYTLGTSAKRQNIIKSESHLQEAGFELFDINRGGDITYHGPGQITGYLIFDLELLYRDIHKYVSNVELAIILTLRDFGLDPVRVTGYTGVWIRDAAGMRKICAIGVHLSRWVSLHGFGLNICSDLSHFDNIIPCGIADNDKSVTSLSKEMGQQITIGEVRPILLDKLKQVFKLKIVNE